jgi:hypothetical protein
VNYAEFDLPGSNSSSCGTKFRRIENVDVGHNPPDNRPKPLIDSAQLAKITSFKDFPEDNSCEALEAESKSRSREEPVRLLDLIRLVRIPIPPIEMKHTFSTDRGAGSQLGDWDVDGESQSPTLDSGVENMQVSRMNGNAHKSDEAIGPVFLGFAGARFRGELWTCCRCWNLGMTTWIDDCDDCGHPLCSDCETYRGVLGASTT